MNKSRNALRASIGLAAVALSLSLVSFVSAAHVTPTEVAGNPTCSDLVPGTTELKVEPVEDGTFTDGTLTVTIDVRDTDDGPVFDWTSNIGVDAVFAKGGNSGNLYLYDPESTGDTGLHAPLNPSGLWAGLSHISFCYDVEPPTPSPSPSPSPSPTLPPTGTEPPTTPPTLPPTDTGSPFGPTPTSGGFVWLFGLIALSAAGLITYGLMTRAKATARRRS